MENSTDAGARNWDGKCYRRLDRSDNDYSTSEHEGCRRDRLVPHGSGVAAPSSGGRIGSRGYIVDHDVASDGDAPANDGGRPDNRNIERSVGSPPKIVQPVLPSLLVGLHSRFRPGRVVPCRATNMRQTG